MGKEQKSMEFTTEVQPLREALKALPSVAKKTDIYLFPKDGSLSLKTHADGVEILITLPCDCRGWEAPGDGCGCHVPKLLERIEHAPSSFLKMQHDGRGKLACSHAGGSFSLVSSYIEPVNTEAEAGEVEGFLSLPWKSLAGALKICLPFVHDDLTRPNMAGVLLDCLKVEDAWAVASDGGTLAKVPLSEATASEEGFKTMLPTPAVAFLLKYCKGGEVRIERPKSDGAPCSRIFCQNAELRYEDSFRLYPNYNSVIPTEESIQGEEALAVEDLKEALLSCAGKSNKKSMKWVTLEFAGDTAKLSYENEVAGVKNSTSFPLVAGESSGKIAFLMTAYNLQRIAEALKTCKAGMATFYYTDPTQVCLIQPDSCGAVFLLAPSRRGYY